MTTTACDISRSVVMHNVPWRTYASMVEELAEQHVRLTYDRGTLEIMSPSPKHEHAGNMIGRLIFALAEELGRDISGFGSTTFRREELGQGIEPDECYYVQHELVMRNKDEIDLSVDPPPDLAVEIDVASSSIDREPVCAGLGVPELWRFRDGKLIAMQLGPAGRYEPLSRSLAFPELIVADLNAFISLRGTMSDFSLIAQFRDWVRATMKPNP